MYDQNDIDENISLVIKNNLNFINDIANVQNVELKDDNSEVLHYEKAIEAILTNIVEKVLKEYIIKK